MAAFPQDLDAEWQRVVRRRVLAWYRRNARNLPWRESADPYRVWISEIMLQQTTIAAVKPYFDRFLKHFPSVQSLAAASEAAVLRQWEGLGYYSRARNLRKAAQMIVADFGGTFPEHVDDLLKLPGVGPYTARAVASVAFGRPVGILEANTIRLYSRLIELDQDPRSGAGNRVLWEFADWIVAPRAAASFNQAAMDIGSTICRPDNPDCDRCPLQHQCQAFRSGRQNVLPCLPARKQMTDVTEVALVLRRGDQILMRQYADGERWAGMWDFARFPVSREIGDQMLSLPVGDGPQSTLFASESIDATVAFAQEQTGLTIAAPRLLKQIRHTVTRFRIRLLCIVSSGVRGRVARDSGLVWQSSDRLDQLPLSTTARKIADLLQT